MRVKRNDCVGCSSQFGYCRGEVCPYYGEYKVLECDDCGVQEEYLYKYEDKELCENCLLEYFEKVELEEY